VIVITPSGQIGNLPFARRQAIEGELSGIFDRLWNLGGMSDIEGRLGQDAYTYSEEEDNATLRRFRGEDD